MGTIQMPIDRRMDKLWYYHNLIGHNSQNRCTALKCKNTDKSYQHTVKNTRSQKIFFLKIKN